VSSVVILGDGILGSCVHEKTDWDILSRKKSKLNIDDIKEYDQLFKNKNVIVNCIANTKTYSNDHSHIKTNYEFVINLVDFCLDKNIKLVHISTGYVYANNTNNPTEEDLPVPQNTLYAYSKLLADEYIKVKLKKYAIIRSVHKPNPFPYNHAFIDHIGNFIYANEVADFIIDCVNKDLNGIYNVGKDLESIYEFAKTTNPTVEPKNKPNEIPELVQFDCSKYKKYLNEKNSFSY
jgi:dTDP-4-dehydrorhamnose reductase